MSGHRTQEAGDQEDPQGQEDSRQEDRKWMDLFLPGWMHKGEEEEEEAVPDGCCGVVVLSAGGGPRLCCVQAKTTKSKPKKATAKKATKPKKTETAK